MISLSLKEKQLQCVLTIFITIFAGFLLFVNSAKINVDLRCVFKNIYIVNKSEFELGKVS
jgi:hypothetical protein